MIVVRRYKLTNTRIGVVFLTVMSEQSERGECKQICAYCAMENTVFRGKWGEESNLLKEIKI